MTLRCESWFTGRESDEGVDEDDGEADFAIDETS